jgi:dipeptide/tripeptide permease
MTDTDLLRDDWVLRISLVVTRILQLLLGLAMLALILGAVALAFDRDLVAELGANRERFTPQASQMLAIVVLAGAVALIMLGVQFLDKLARIVQSVALGDPFVPANAARLRAMGWLLLATQLGGLALGIFAKWVGPDMRRFAIDDGFSAVGMLAVLVLFILARVFAHGAAMRDDIEGTV